MSSKYLCAFCSNPLELTGDVCSDNGALKVGICDSCGLKQLNSFFHVSTEYYADDNHFSEEPEAIRKRERSWNIKRMALLLKWIPGIRKLKVLDFGCGPGGFLEQSWKEMEDICGFELSKRVCNINVKNGWRCFSSIGEVPPDREVIMLFHVLEHIPRPWDLLLSLRERFPHAETFVIEVPNTQEALNSLFQNAAYGRNHHSSEHLYYFSSETLRRVVNAGGLAIEMETQVQRYSLANHLGWLKNNRGGGQDVWPIFNDPQLNENYEKLLVDQKVADSLFLICIPSS